MGRLVPQSGEPVTGHIWKNGANNACEYLLLMAFRGRLTFITRVTMEEQVKLGEIAFHAGRLRYYEQGSGPALLLIHGSGPGVSGLANFAGNLPVLAQRHRCIVVDLPGYGQSEAVAGDAIALGVEACVALLQALNVGAAHIIGNSLGGIVGSHLAAQHPDLVKSLVSIGGVGLNLFTSFPGEGLNLLTAFVEDPSRDRLARWLHSMVYDPAIVTPELLEMRYAQATEPKTLATSRAIYSKEAIAAIAQMRRAKPEHAIAHLAAIQAPTLLVWGRDDRVSPLDISLIPMRLIPNCELHVFPQCGHWAMIECKDRFEALVQDFFAAAEKRSEPH